jgi:MFS family permease
MFQVARVKGMAGSGLTRQYNRPSLNALPSAKDHEMSVLPLSLNRNFRLLFSATAISNLGDGVTAVALPWLAAMLTRDPVLVAMVAAAGRLPWLVFSLPAGVVTDQADRRRLIVQMDAIRAILTCGVIAVALSPVDQGTGLIWLLSLFAFLLGAAEVLRDNAAQSLLPAIVRTEDLERANGRMWSVEEIATRFIGPPLAGALIGIGIALPFGLDAASFALASALIWMIALPPDPTRIRQAFWPALVEGLAWMRDHPFYLRLAVMLAFVNLLYAACMAIFVLYGQEVLKLDATGYGLILTVGALGGVVGGLYGPNVAAALGLRGAVNLSMLLFVAAYLLFGLVGTPAAAALALFIEGFAGILWNVVTVSYRQRMIPAGILGRVNAIYRFFGSGVMAVGAIVGGLMVAWSELAMGRMAALHLPFLIAAAGYAVLTGWSLLNLRFNER